MPTLESKITPSSPARPVQRELYHGEGESMECPECNMEMEMTDTTFSNTNTKRAVSGQHTGNIWRCNNSECSDDCFWLENLLEGGSLEHWSY